MLHSVNIDSIALAFPKTIRTNKLFEDHAKDLVDRVKAGANLKLFQVENNYEGKGAAFHRAYVPYATDPFRGAVERRVMVQGDTCASLEVTAVKRALAAAQKTNKDIDLVICAALIGDNPIGGSATATVVALDIEAPMVNIETACAGGQVGTEMAAQAIASGAAKCVLVVTSCNYSRHVDAADPLGWFVGDGAAAMVISKSQDAGILAQYSYNTSFMREHVRLQICKKSQGGFGGLLSISRDSGKMLYTETERALRTCWQHIQAATNCRLDDIKCFAFPAVSAYHVVACADILQIDPERCVHTFPQYANIGPVATIANLYHSLQKFPPKTGDLVLLFSFGANATTSMSLWRWGTTKLAADIDNQGTSITNEWFGEDVAGEAALYVNTYE